MTGDLNPLAPHHLPSFITAPGQTDTLMIVAAISLVAGIALVGVFYFKLHALPEHMSHGRASKIQFEIIAVLALLALFTHNSLYWIAALLLAMVRIPDFETPIKIMARSLGRMAKAMAGPTDAPATAQAGPTPAAAAPILAEPVAVVTETPKAEA